jgi:hypothetical protein
MTQIYKAPNGRNCVIVEVAKPANPHTLIDDPKHASSHTDLGRQAMQSLTENKLKAEHVVIQYMGPNGEHLGNEEVRKDSLTLTDQTI